MRAMYLTAMLCLAPMVGLAQSPNPGGNDAQPQAKASADGSKLVCERKKALGSNRPERVCKTQDEWDAERAKAHADLQRYGRCSGNDMICTGQP